jgi:excisionase family DNA binding protein
VHEFLTLAIDDHSRCHDVMDDHRTSTYRGDPDLLLTTSQVAESFAVSVSTVRRLRRAGELRAVRVGHAVRFRLADVHDFLTARSDMSAASAVSSTTLERRPP